MACLHRRFTRAENLKLFVRIRGVHEGDFILWTDIYEGITTDHESMISSNKFDQNKLRIFPVLTMSGIVRLIVQRGNQTVHAAYFTDEHLRFSLPSSSLPDRDHQSLRLVVFSLGIPKLTQIE